MTRLTLRAAGHALEILREDTAPGAIPAPPDTALYLHAATEGELAAVWERVPHAGLALVGVGDFDWNADLSPWPARRAFRGGEDFAGRADAHLRALTGAIVPAAEAALGGAPARRGLAGYSLAGLFALYALYQTDYFSLVGSMSGSLWYDGFLDWMAARTPAAPNARVYLSLGDAEAHARSPRLSAVADCTLRAQALLDAAGATCAFCWEPGNHFADAPGRVARGAAWLLDRADVAHR